MFPADMILEKTGKKPLTNEERMMKKLLLIGLVITSISSVAYASYQGEGCNGSNKFIKNLNLDDARTTEVEYILSSYKQVKDLAKNGQFDQIPQFIEDKNAELAAVLTEEEMTLFKENIGQWAENKDFSKFMKFGGKFLGNNH